MPQLLVRSRHLIMRFLVLLPIVLAVGIWSAHQPLASDLLEFDPHYPISLSTLMADVPVCPDANGVLLRRPVIVVPHEECAPVLPALESIGDTHSRGPPVVAH
jgi:hypothetical protein